MQKLLFITLINGVLAFSGAAQTGRIAHFSHSGSAVMLAKEKEREDNFGYYHVVVIEEVKRLSDSTAARRGYMYYSGSGKREIISDTIQFLTHDKRAIANGPDWFLRSCGLGETLESIRERNPKAVLIGFDKTQQAGQPQKTKKPVPKKPSGHMEAFPKRPFQYSYWRGLASAAALGAVGWLLGKKRAA